MALSDIYCAYMGFTSSASDVYLCQRRSSRCDGCELDSHIVTRAHCGPGPPARLRSRHHQWSRDRRPGGPGARCGIDRDTVTRRLRDFMRKRKFAAPVTAQSRCHSHGHSPRRRRHGDRDGGRRAAAAALTPDSVRPQVAALDHNFLVKPGPGCRDSDCCCGHRDYRDQLQVEVAPSGRSPSHGVTAAAAR